MKDMPLLEKFVRENSESAFKELVERHLNLVYAAALRQVRDASLAQDVTQAVFLILSRKAARLPANTILSGWLYRTTYFVAAKALRSELRRKHHELEAAQMQTIEFAAPDRAWEKLEPLLDSAMAQLCEKDRNAILLRYFEKKDFGSVGYALGTSEDAAQKRVSRALEKLRRLLSNRGIVLPCIALGSALAAHATNTAPGLNAAEIIVENCFSKSVIAPGIYSLVQASLQGFFWATFAKTAGVTALLLACGFFFAANLPRQTNDKEISRSFGPKNNSLAPKKRSVMQNPTPQPVALASLATTTPVRAQSEIAPVVVTPIQSAPQITNAPLLSPVVEQPPRIVNTAAAQTRRAGSYVIPSAAKPDTNLTLPGLSLMPTNETRPMLPVYNPRRSDRPAITRSTPARKATLRSRPRDDNDRRVF